MGIYRTVLIVFLLILFMPEAAFPAQRNACLTCHESHYVKLGTCVHCHRGNDRTGRKEIAHHKLIAGRFTYFTIKGEPIVKRGKELVDILACRRCHIYGGKGNRLATNLGRLAANTTPQGIFDSIKSPVLFMPNFHCNEIQIAAIVNAVLAGTESTDPKIGETAQVVHFEDEKQGRENSFVKLCGPCHKVLSERFGGLGKGDIGSNLSGLFSEFYPKTYRDAEPWAPDKLKKWLENPRNIRPNARMRPVSLTADEFELLVATIRIHPESYPQMPTER